MKKSNVFLKGVVNIFIFTYYNFFQEGEEFLKKQKTTNGDHQEEEVTA